VAILLLMLLVKVGLRSLKDVPEGLAVAGGGQGPGRIAVERRGVQGVGKAEEGDGRASRWGRASLASGYSSSSRSIWSWAAELGSVSWPPPREEEKMQVGERRSEASELPAVLPGLLDPEKALLKQVYNGSLRSVVAPMPWMQGVSGWHTCQGAPGAGWVPESEENLLSACAGTLAASIALCCSSCWLWWTGVRVTRGGGQSRGACESSKRSGGRDLAHHPGILWAFRCQSACAKMHSRAESSKSALYAESTGSRRGQRLCCSDGR
jgi:hypothetical protein